MPGDGQIDLQSEIKILKEIGYNKTVSLELLMKIVEEKPEETLKLA